jgi:hypothetical protein
MPNQKVRESADERGGKRRAGAKGADVCTISGISIHPNGMSTRGTVTAKPLGKALPGMTTQEVVARVLEDGTWTMSLVVSRQAGNYLFRVAGSQYVVKVPSIQAISFDDLVEKHSVKEDDPA